MNGITFKFMSLENFCRASALNDRASSRFSYEFYKDCEYKCIICNKAIKGAQAYCTTIVDITRRYSKNSYVYTNSIICSEGCFNMKVLQMDQYEE